MAKRKGPRKPAGKVPESVRPRNPGLPDPKTVVSERLFVSPKGRRFRIITTTEKDPYDPDHSDTDKDTDKATDKAKDTDKDKAKDNNNNNKA
jgi:hypothetical protein